MSKVKQNKAKRPEEEVLAGARVLAEGGVEVRVRELSLVECLERFSAYPKVFQALGEHADFGALLVALSDEELRGEWLAFLGTVTGLSVKEIEGLPQGLAMQVNAEAFVRNLSFFGTAAGLQRRRTAVAEQG